MVMMMMMMMMVMMMIMMMMIIIIIISKNLCLLFVSTLDQQFSTTVPLHISVPISLF